MSINSIGGGDLEKFEGLRVTVIRNIEAIEDAGKERFDGDKYDTEDMKANVEKILALLGVIEEIDDGLRRYIEINLNSAPKVSTAILYAFVKKLQNSKQLPVAVDMLRFIFVKTGIGGLIGDGVARAGECLGLRWDRIDEDFDLLTAELRGKGFADEVVSFATASMHSAYRGIQPEYIDDAIFGNIFKKRVPYSMTNRSKLGNNIIAIELSRANYPKDVADMVTSLHESQTYSNFLIALKKHPRFAEFDINRILETLNLYETKLKSVENWSKHLRGFGWDGLLDSITPENIESFLKVVFYYKVKPSNATLKEFVDLISKNTPPHDLWNFLVGKNEHKAIWILIMEQKNSDIQKQLLNGQMGAIGLQLLSAPVAFGDMIY